MDTGQTPSIFVSYRIADTLPIADRLAAELQRTFGAEVVFFDRRTIEPGDTWDSNIEIAVRRAMVVLVLIGKKWLTEQNEYGRRRLDVPGDWVRREVETALDRTRYVIPVLVDGASPPPKEAFFDVPSIAALSSCQGALLRTKDWDTDFNALVERLAATAGLRLLTAAEAERVIIPGRIATRGQTPFVGRVAELDALAERLPPIGTPGVIVVRGKPGVGKSEVAREYARRHQAGYANGAFFISMEKSKTPVALATYGRHNLGLDVSGLPIEDQCTYVLRKLSAPTLLIYDNVIEPHALLPWLPADDESTHALITTTWEDWQLWPQVEITALDDTHALDVVKALGGPQVAEQYGAALVTKAVGLPIQLCPATLSVSKALRRHGNVQITISNETQASFTDVWDRLDPEGRLLLAAATLFNPDRIRADLLRSHLAEAAGWSAGTVDAALNACMDLSLLDPGEEELRMHRLLWEYVRSAEGADPAQLARFRDAHVSTFLLAAQAVGEHPADSALIADLLCYPLAPENWSITGHPLALSGSDCHSIGVGLSEIGLFDEAKPWCERAVAELEQGDIHGRVDHQSLGNSLHRAGYCLSESGDYEGARPWFERAVAEQEQGDLHREVDHQSLGNSLHEVGLCLSQTGNIEGARPWYERAVVEQEQGDVHGRVDHQSLGRSLHQVGSCLSRTGNIEGARSWFERAVAEAEQGDVHGRVDHDKLGRSLQQVGSCLFQTGDHEGARHWFERAVAEKAQGDVHGRVDHASLNNSLHQVGYYLSQTGDYEEARPWFEQAVAEAEQGDVHGRIDHQNLGITLNLVGYCLYQTGGYDGAMPWFERAIAEVEQGDVHGRVNHEGLGVSLHLVGYCLSQTGDYEEARPWFERAIAEKEHGDVNGRIDHQSLGVSLHQVGYCLSQTRDYEVARPWYERAAAEAEQGNVHGRIDHQSLGVSLHQVGECLSQTRHYEEARPWFERAIVEKEQGDVRGRVDHQSLGVSLHQVGYCLAETGDCEGARSWFERAIVEKEQGDVYGRIDYQSLGHSLHQVGSCLSQTGDHEGARPWYQRAIAEKEKGDIRGCVDQESLEVSTQAVDTLSGVKSG